ncbi:MAG: ATP-dependent DNA helicase RecG [Clostridia bacterium]|nr:ATP-dependent DNA helicase RecG [Clostridia bacterium]
MLTWESPVSVMRGVGSAREKSLASLEIRTVGDLLYHVPRGYQCRGNVKTLSEAAEMARRGEDLPVSLLLTVAAEPQYRMIRRGMSILRFRAFDETGTCEITYFNQNYLRDVFHTGGEFRFFGRISVEGRTLKMSSPIWEACVPGAVLPGIVPVYSLRAGLSQKILSGLVRDALSGIGNHLPETIPPEVTRSQSLCTLSYAIKNIHFPEDGEALARARRRLIFEEYFTFGLAVASATQPEMDGVRIPREDLTPFTKELPYALTGAQMRSVEEIASDMSSGRRMNRILIGDVGSGKTAVAAAAAYLAACGGYQTALMAPTEILAVQHYKELSDLLGRLGIECVLLTGAVTGARRRAVCESLAREGGASVVVGTHALLNESVQFTRLGLVIEDEQHRFGVRQRAALAEKNESAHVLVMSATPIPRTLSLVTYGGICVSRLDEMPPGRQVVDTFVVDEGYRTRLNAFIRRQTDEGHQVYIVCPSVEENPDKKIRIPDDPEELADLIFGTDGDTAEKPPLKAAVEFAETVAAAFPDLHVAFVHGKMKNADKDRVMQAFSEGEIHILVSTTVIEVGVNVPNATLMIIENAERFGLSQLHQLRGRVGRGKAKSYCVLVSDAKGSDARARLDVLKKNHDGNAIAEEDLRLRGPGDFLQTGGEIRQHGDVRLPVAAGPGDVEILAAAMEEARGILERDPTLARPEHAALRKAAEAALRDTANTMN